METAKEVKIFNLNRFLIDRYKLLAERFYKANRTLARKRAIWGTLLAALGTFGYYTAYAYIAWRTIRGDFSIGDLTFLSGSFLRLRQLLEGLLTGFSQVAGQALYLDDLFSFFAIEPEIRSRPDALPVPRPIAAFYMREGLRYKAAILMERLEGVRSLADRALVAGRGAPWEETGRLIARFHRAGLDHADLNAHNILFDANGHGWLIDFDRGVLRIPATRWRERNLKRLLRSLIKLRGERSHDDVEKDYARLRRAYDLAWNRGY